MYKHEGLVLAGLIKDLFVADLVGDLVALDGLFLRNTYKLLLKSTRTVGRVEIEQALLLVHPKEGCNILVIWERGRKSYEPHVLVRLLHPPNRPRNNTLHHRTTLIVQQMDLVDDNEDWCNWFRFACA